ncbi:receptor-like kinase, partial [Trifolium pratense]
VLVDKYGVEDGQVRAGGRKDSNWWNDVCSLREGVELSVGRWFDNNINRKVSNGKHTFFWKDIARRGWCVGGEGMRWRGFFLRGRELYLECCVALENFFLQVGVQDCWKRYPDPDSG